MAYAAPYKREAGALLQLGLPLIGSQLAALAIGITDVIMLGRYSVDALAAGVLGHSVLFAFIMLGAGFAFAVMPLVATADAEGDRTTLRRVTRMGLWLSVGFGIVMLPLMCSIKGSVAHLFYKNYRLRIASSLDFGTSRITVPSTVEPPQIRIPGGASR